MTTENITCRLAGCDHDHEGLGPAIVRRRRSDHKYCCATHRKAAAGRVIYLSREQITDAVGALDQLRTVLAAWADSDRR